MEDQTTYAEHPTVYTSVEGSADPVVDTGEWVLVRQKRDKLLQDSDWTQLPDVVMDAGLQQQWKTYRQQLRDITAQPDPFNIVWPTPPA